MAKKIWLGWAGARIIQSSLIIQLLFVGAACNSWTEGYKIDRGLEDYDLKSTKTNFTVSNHELVGDVKLATIYKFEAKESFGEAQKVDYGIIAQKLEFNNDGKIAENSVFRFGELMNKYVFKYDYDGHLIELNRYLKDGSLDDRTTFEYDLNGNLSHKKTDFYACDYTYDDKDNLLERHYMSIDQSKEVDYVYNDKYIYDLKNRLVEIEYSLMWLKDNPRKEKGVEKYIYDKRGNLIEIQTLDSLDLIERRDLYTYDKRKRLTEYELFTIEDGTLKLNVKRIIEYDDAKEVYRVKDINSEGAHVSTALFKNNFCIERRSLDNVIYTEVTRFDKFNNWTHKVVKNPYCSEHLGEFPLTIWEREIDYY